MEILCSLFCACEKFYPLTVGLSDLINLLEKNNETVKNHQCLAQKRVGEQVTANYSGLEGWKKLKAQ